MDKDIKDIIKKLGEALNEVLQDSEKIQKLLREVEERGYTLNLSMAVIVAMEEGKNARRKLRQGKAEGRDAAETKTTPFDRRFLRALRIKTTEEQS